MEGGRGSDRREEGGREKVVKTFLNSILFAQGMHHAEASAELARHVAFENQSFSSSLLASLGTSISYALDFSKAKALHTVAIRVLLVRTYSFSSSSCFLLLFLSFLLFLFLLLLLLLLDLLVLVLLLFCSVFE